MDHSLLSASSQPPSQADKLLHPHQHPGTPLANQVGASRSPAALAAVGGAKVRVSGTSWCKLTRGYHEMRATRLDIQFGGAILKAIAGDPTESSLSSGLVILTRLN